ncbi:unnamed protein product [Protopolystoma xenopodis]|uniref:CFAP65-like ninth Ig-like domain-containing protein n=1 Tax=Protopolystoma xenopodis TaxID=117903 RepID=A0A448WV62_9PLAT|nr:unnamed protein product [Protopolystoma xenopodis]
MKVQSCGLFEISPRRGHLAPGEAASLIVAYRHRILGTHRLPVLLKINHGRELMVSLVYLMREQILLHLQNIKVAIPSRIDAKRFGTAC